MNVVCCFREGFFVKDVCFVKERNCVAVVGEKGKISIWSVSSFMKVKEIEDGAEGFCNGIVWD